ncbi:MAG TPA: HAD hydrolase-like protein [Opitutaceae bacterium]|nr:HAD hydrolase-like protein [Opitutaceae bacterium]
MSEPKQSVVTFDIWDTCIARATGSPESIFRATARALLAGGTDSEIAALAKQRDEAEDEARKNVENRECTFAEIEAALAKSVGAELAAAYVATELRIERASARPNVAIRAEVAKARAAGSLVAFISDMYLPGSFLRTLLEDHGFALPTDPVFVSCEHRANKHSGKMYEIVRRELSLEGRHWTHIGDNSGSDIVMARRSGATTIEVRASDWTAAEKRVLESARSHSERIAGAMRATRLAADPAIPPGRAAFLAGVAAPWLVALTTRMLSMAREDGRRRIYFAARDGEIPLRIARILAPEGVDCRYLPGSRKAWCLPAMFDLSPACTSWLRLAPMRPDTLLASLGFPESEREPILSRCGFDGAARSHRCSQEELAPIWADIAANGLGSAISRRAAEARVACVAFLRAEGLFDEVPWTIADVGWSLHGQAALKRMLADAGARQEPHGIYFMIRNDRRPVSETGPAHAWIVGDENQSNDSTNELLSWMSPVVEECLLTSADPSVTGYSSLGGAATPVHADSRPTPGAVRHAAELRAFAEAFAREILAEARDPEFIATLESCALEGLLHFLREPAEHEVTALRGLQHATAPGAPANDTQPLVRPYSLGDATNLVLRRAGLQRGGQNHEPYWHTGSMAVTPTIARAAMKGALAPNPLKRIFRGPR